MSLRINILLLSCCGLLFGCTGNEVTPEQEVREFIERGIEAAESRDSDTLEDQLHLNFIDQKGNNRKQVGALLHIYFLRHKNIHLFSKINEIDLINDNEARVDLYVAMAGSVISDVTALASLRARVYHFELNLIKDGDWLLQHAEYKPASLGELE